MKKKINIGVIGCGAIGSNIISFVRGELRAEARISGVCDLDRERIKRVSDLSGVKVQIMEEDEVIKNSDLIVETASISAAAAVIPKVMRASKDIVALSVGVFIKVPQLIDIVKKSKGNVYIPAGAIAGLDGIFASRRSGIRKVKLITSKPPVSLSGVDYLRKKKIDVFHINKETVVFKGDIKSAIKYFPQNINVAAVLFLFSGYADIEVIIKVVPGLTRNVHSIEVYSEAADIKIEVENIPFPDNPKTSYLAILSAQDMIVSVVRSAKKARRQSFWDS